MSSSVIVVSVQVLIHIKLLITKFGNVKVKNLTLTVGNLRPEFIKHLVGFPLNKHSMARDGGHLNPPCGSSSTGTLKPTVVEVSIAEDLTIHQFEHTKLIGHHITLSINTVAVDVCCRTIIAAQEQTIILDRLHQCPQSNQVRVTIKVGSSDSITRTNAGIQLLLNLCRFLYRNELHSKCHHTGKLADFFNISEGFLIVKNVCFRLHELDVLSVSPDATVRHSNGITKVALSIIASVRSDDNVLGYDVPELISDGVRSVLIQSTETDEVSLIDCLHTGQMVKARMQNLCYIPLMVCINVLVRFVDFDFNFVEDTFGAHEEVSGGRIRAPDNSRSTINLDTQSARIHEPIQNGKVSRQDGIFGVFEVGVFHTVIVRCQEGVWGEPCASSPSVTGSVETHTTKERNCTSIRYTHKPIKVLLKYTLTINPVPTKNSIQAGFGSYGLMIAIKQLNPARTNLGNQITVQKNFGNLSSTIPADLSVSTTPIPASGDSIVHLAFDLTHRRNLINKRSMARLGHQRNR